MDELVDILQPPLFTPTRQVKSRQQAYRDGNWTGAFNLWVVTKQPKPSIVYQQRGPNKAWAPNLLDVTAGGHFEAGEELTDGLREVREELGKDYAPDQVKHLGRKLIVDFNTDGTTRNEIIDIYMIEDDQPLSTYHLDETEVYAICTCPVEELLKAHQDESYSFSVDALTANGEKTKILVNKKSFPENWDDYHHKIAILMSRYFKGERDLLY